MKILSRNFAFSLMILLAFSANAQIPSNEWPQYGRDLTGMRYSPLKQINVNNVKQLQVAWKYVSKDFSDGSGKISQTSFEVTPIYFNQALYLCTPFNRVVALDPGTGKELWSFNPKVDIYKTAQSRKTDGAPLRCRGLASWIDTQAAANSACQKRIFAPVIDGRVIALDANTGKLCKDFGTNGEINLNQFENYGKGQLSLSSPPTIYKNLVIVGSAIGDNGHADMPDGIVRAFNAKTGKLIWQFDPIPKDMRHKTGAGNVWSFMSVDTKNGIVYLPTTSPSPDYYGGLRKQDLPYTSAVVALNAATGKPIWHYQLVRHNLWDYDAPSQPLLFDLKQNGKTVPVVAQATKMGFIFIFNRLTGKPIFPILEKQVPQSNVPGEQTATTQPIPSMPKALEPTTINADQAWGLLYFDENNCRKALARLENKGLYTPPSIKGSIAYPSFAGVTNWGGMSYDPKNHLLIVNSSNILGVAKLIPRAQFAAEKRKFPQREITAQLGTPYGMERYLLVSPLGIPCNPPPWGHLTAVDVKTGAVKWRIPYGQVKKGPFYSFRRWGSPIIGGASTTAGNLIFISATMDNTFRAIDVLTGKILWSYQLPYYGTATPMTYAYKGKQYVVIAAGGHAALDDFGATLVAFSLPNSNQN